MKDEHKERVRRVKKTVRKNFPNKKIVTDLEDYDSREDLLHIYENEDGKREGSVVKIAYERNRRYGASEVIVMEYHSDENGRAGPPDEKDELSADEISGRYIITFVRSVFDSR